MYISCSYSGEREGASVQPTKKKAFLGYPPIIPTNCYIFMYFLINGTNMGSIFSTPKRRFTIMRT